MEEGGSLDWASPAEWRPHLQVPRHVRARSASREEAVEGDPEEEAPLEVVEDNSETLTLVQHSKEM